ncbi:diguanylate cyclase domain-containing protein [Pseudomonas sp. NPDC078700]|uniref:GGDEF domain-containing protein n=1 Tax=Pseudomonas sp. NPDC078700 TaxID=3364424 RepID=UPI0037C8675C
MSKSAQALASRTLQSLMLKRFGMAVFTYLLAIALGTIAFRYNQLEVPLANFLLLIGGVVLSQFAFLGIFLSGRNLLFQDPSLTEPQVLAALVWQTLTLAILDDARGPMLVMYVLILMFGVFQLPPKVFVRCAIVAFIGFAGLNLIDAYHLKLTKPGLAVLEVCVLSVALAWLSLFAGYVHSMRQRMRQRRFALQAHQDTLRGMMRQLEDLASTDELTGLFNRRHFLNIASRELSSLRRGHQHGLALIDLDHFKRINDVYGHASGDRVLQTFASVAQTCLRDGDVIARYGGEEFVLLLPDTEPDHFVACCERLRETFSRAEPLGIKVDNLSLSIGMTLLKMDDDLDEALHRADQALYQAKRTGRNRCAAAWEGASA